MWKSNRSRIQANLTEMKKGIAVGRIRIITVASCVAALLAVFAFLIRPTGEEMQTMVRPIYLDKNQVADNLERELDVVNDVSFVGNIHITYPTSLYLGHSKSIYAKVAPGPVKLDKDLQFEIEFLSSDFVITPPAVASFSSLTSQSPPLHIKLPNEALEGGKLMKFALRQKANGVESGLVLKPDEIAILAIDPVVLFWLSEKQWKVVGLIAGALGIPGFIALIIDSLRSRKKRVQSKKLRRSTT